MVDMTSDCAGNPLSVKDKYGEVTLDEDEDSSSSSEEEEDETAEVASYVGVHGWLCAYVSNVVVGVLPWIHISPL